MIRVILGSPDRLAPNPVFRTMAPMRLYEVERVILAEESEQFAVLRDKAERRSRAALAVAERRRGETVARVEGVSIVVPVVDWHALVREAVAHRNRRDEERAWQRLDHVATPARVADVDELTLQRWVVNYLRHELTGYEVEVEALFGRVGRAEGMRLLRRRIYAAIASAYPTLTEECHRQLESREGETL
ncbi:hypothetical protein Aple_091210 [Acrocarpospora pleiomorpha]|uniref:Uncharacterized protein n=2 Tax=Acrocarpospora pleiomorpha TaxID=90975 RepID=A0A5M3XYW1_9ACTN|nr:hypothetical protein Aple_091210 [Acrocarpospora pleiomorpha]